MLIEFSVENYLSIKERQTLSMVAAKDRAMPQNIFANAVKPGLSILKCAAIYGANASGKSNFIQAMRFMADFVVRSSREGQRETPIAVTPFRLHSGTAASPSTFEAVFSLDGVRHDYGFSADSKRVHSEWLHAHPKKQARMLFERTVDPKTGESEVKFGAHWEGEKKNLGKLTRANALLISVAAQLNHPLAGTVVDWFGHKMRQVANFRLLGTEMAQTMEMMQSDEEMKALFQKFLKIADLGIRDFRIEAKGESALGNEAGREILMIHAGCDEAGKPIEVPLRLATDESEGTRKLFALAGPWLRALKEGCALVIDELDVCLHPLMTRMLIEMFNSATNNHGAQLIFSTHDSSLLGLDLFRRDQIWFAEKSPEGATAIYSLWEFKPAKGENVRVGYLAGRYGAIPFVGRLPE